ncbi:receptor-like protein kinase HERK 1 [Rutidosis leptorrhynchoides]|uniref:receptor-like protein kinase HERK 1 n=1 Tax=Rutidosis leptorrhynchoides TaxID=125765 RepID=UPI003A999325
MASTITELAHFRIPLEEIINATNNFSEKNIVGRGGFGNVYRGNLKRSGKWLKFSARRLDRRYGQGDVEFMTEISMLSTLKHENIVSMIGFCDENGEKIIVNKSYKMGSLSAHLSKPTPTWIQRVDIALGIARAIEYIHHKLGENYYVIHRNISSFTVLLDENWIPKLSGFEFSIKHQVDRRNQVFHTQTIGTKGYIDQETYKSGGVTHKSDIYSLGVVLCEILCGTSVQDDTPLSFLNNRKMSLGEIIGKQEIFDLNYLPLDTSEYGTSRKLG